MKEIQSSGTIDFLPFAFVVHQDATGIWYSWPWDFAYYVADGSSSQEAIANSKSLLDQELDRRESHVAAYKFKTGKWPPELQRIRERVHHDTQRRKLPFFIKTYDEWLNAFPICLRGTLLDNEGTNSQIVSSTHQCIELICSGRLEEVFFEFPAITTLVPMSDFPQPWRHWSANLLHDLFEENGISLPVEFVEQSSPEIVRTVSEDARRYTGQRLVCGLGATNFTVTAEVILPTSEHQLRIELLGLETNGGTLIALRKVDLQFIEDLS